MGDELEELKENAEKAERDPSLKPVSLTMAILAVFVAAVSLLGHRAHTEELLLQNKATDNWSYYQAKNIRRHTYDLFLDMLSISDPKDSQAAGQIKEKYTNEIKRYDQDLKEIEAEARRLEEETAQAGKKGDRFDLGEVFLEVALVVTSICLLTGRKHFWAVGSLVGVAGLGVAVTALWMH